MNLTKLEQRDIMEEIVPVYTTDTNIAVVNARDLYEALGVKKDFSNWIKSYLKNYKEAESVANTKFAQKGELDFDYFTFEVEGSGPRKRKEYILTLDTAKELAMMSRCEKGRAIRKYFIAVEKAHVQTVHVLKAPELTPEQKIAEALKLSEALLSNTKKELVKANRNKDYNKRINTKLRQEIKALKAELAQAKSNPSASNEEIESIKEKLREALETADYWEGAYANLEIKFDTKSTQLDTVLSVKKDGKKYFNMLSHKHAASILINDADKRQMKANVFRKSAIEQNREINYSNRFTSNFIDRIHPKSIPSALETYYNALKNRLGSNFEQVIGNELINDIESFLQESKDSLSEI